MQGVEFRGEIYNDDRMFVLYICKCTVASVGNGLMETTIYHEDAPEDSKWCLVTYKNVASYPAFRADAFDTLEAAQEYVRAVEPDVPLVSLGGSSPRTPLPYDQYVEWKTRNGFQEYDYKRLYLPGGTDPVEIVLSRC